MGTLGYWDRPDSAASPHQPGNRRESAPERTSPSPKGQLPCFLSTP